MEYRCHRGYSYTFYIYIRIIAYLYKMFFIPCDNFAL